MPSEASVAGPLGEGIGVVSFGETRVPERVSVNVFFRPGGYIFYVHGGTPTLIEVMSEGTVFAATPPYAQLMSGEVPLVGSVPGGFDGSIEQLKITIGAAYERHGKLISYATAPSSCPRQGFVLVKAEMSFLDGETIPVTSKIACPKRRR